MTFGKSNAKIYAESETGITFADVAGEEEAKDALKEIVDFLHKSEKYSEIGARRAHLCPHVRTWHCEVMGRAKHHHQPIMR